MAKCWQLKLAAEANHYGAMYLYGMILSNKNQLTEGSTTSKKTLERKKGWSSKTMLTKLSSGCSRDECEVIP